MGMLLSAIDSGFIDFILPPKAIAKQLEDFPKIIYSIAADNKPAETSEIVRHWNSKKMNLVALPVTN